MERELRPIGNTGHSEMILTANSTSERDQLTRVVPSVMPETHEMCIEWVTEMKLRIYPKEKAKPAAPPDDNPMPVAAAPTAATDAAPLPPLPALLAGDKAAMTTAKLANLENACVEAGCPVEIGAKTPRANIVAAILKWRETRAGPTL